MRFMQPAVMVLGAAMYAVVLAFLTQFEGGHDDPWILAIAGVWNLALLGATVIAIVHAVLQARPGKTRKLAADAMIVKLVAIPFFVLNFLVLFIAFPVAAVSAVFGDPLYALIYTASFGLTYLAMLSTSVPTWAAIAQLRRERLIGTGRAVLYSLLALVYAADLWAGVLVFGHSRRRPRLALVWLLIVTGVTLVLLGLLVLLALLGQLDSIGAFQLVRDSAAMWMPFTLFGIGTVVVLVTLIVSIVRRSTLRDEGQRAPATNDLADQALPD